MKRWIIALVAVAILTTAYVWVRNLPKGCAPGTFASGAITDASTGKIIGTICQGPSKKRF